MRFGELGDYNILGEATVYFAQWQHRRRNVIEAAIAEAYAAGKTVIAYVLLVEGYASKVGSSALNQKLSAERAENVTTYLEQQCGIPLTNMLAPGRHEHK